MTTEREPTVVVIGAGLAGITMAHVLEQSGFTDYEVLEKGSDVGGVWHWNRYPGLTCDVPSHLYQFGFAPKPDWSSVWASGTEIQRYHRDVVDDLGLDRRISLDTEVSSAEFDDTTKRWHLTTADGRALTADFVICATGVLHNPEFPDIPGLQDFRGDVVHTARWDGDLDTENKRIAVIGTGSTGVQVFSALQPTSESIVHFVRSPQWVLWAPMRLRQPRLVSSVLEKLPALNRRLYDVLLWSSAILADITTKPSWRRRLAQNYARMSLRAQVRDTTLRDSLTPDYEPLCKRQVVSGRYYRAARADNARVLTERIESINRSGVRTADGYQHDVDTIILATGFRAHDYMRPMKITGRAGRTLDQIWSGGPRAYRMTAVPGLPNLFTVLGPNSPTGSISLQYSSELTARYIVQWLQRFKRGELDSVEVTDEATDAFNQQVAEAMGPTVWNTGCNSWYVTESGAIDLWPFDRETMTRMLSSPNEDHFSIARPS